MNKDEECPKCLGLGENLMSRGTEKCDLCNGDKVVDFNTYNGFTKNLSFGEEDII